MNRSLSTFIIILLIVFSSGKGNSQTTPPEPETLKIGSIAPDFNLLGVDGKTYSLKSFEKASVLVIIFSCNHCPTAQAYEDRILRYSGRIDGSEKPGTGKGEDIRNAIDEVLAGKSVKNPTTKVFGCSVKWSWKDEYTQRLYKEWSELPVKLEDIDVQGIKEIVRNTSSDKLRLINIWATWCGPCVTEFPDMVIIDRMYRGRSFEFITISADKQARKGDALKFLQKQEASNKNYIFNKDDVYQMIEAVDPDWQGALPYTMLIEPGGKIIYKKQDMINPAQMRKMIVENKFIGRYY
ncbi:MAG TPA: TlpA family protein disulfide reductase [Bacteroidales bacterium]|nr:TlpA family protein disulfide reductase [Bacteroidales bacterium]